MWAAVWTMTMPWFLSNTKEKEIAYEYIPSDSKNYELETLDKALINIKDYFPNFSFDTSRVKNDLSWISSLKLSETAIASFIAHKWPLFKNKFPWFNPNLLFYNLNSNWEKTPKTIEETIECLRRIIKIEITKRENNKSHSSEELYIWDIINFIQSHFITHIIYLLEKSFNALKSELTHYYTWFITKAPEQIVNKKHWINKSNNIPKEQLNYLRDTLSWIMNHHRRMIENYEAIMKNELFWDDFFAKPLDEVQPRMIKQPYIKQEMKTWSVTEKFKWLFNNIFSRK